MPWAIRLSSQNLLDGYREHYAHETMKGQRANVPILFVSREAARAWAKERYGYIAKRPDLRREPHGWFPPKVVKVKLSLQPLT